MAKDYYKTLQLSRTAQQPEVFNSYRNLALKWHPSKNQDNLSTANKIFHQISEAFQVISDPIKRKLYDNCGEFGLKQGVQTENGFVGGYSYIGNAPEIFEQFFGSQSPIPQGSAIQTDLGSLFGRALQFVDSPEQEPPQVLIVEVPCTLEELYNGCIKSVKYSRTVLSGDMLTFGVVQQEKKLEILKGYGKETRLVFSGQGNQSVKYSNSDLVIQVVEVPHKTFQKRGSDLILVKSITLIEAIMAEPVVFVRFIQNTLDGRALTISFRSVITPKTQEVIENQGFEDRSGTGKLRGRLIVRFSIRFPKFIPEEHKVRLREILS